MCNIECEHNLKYCQQKVYCTKCLREWVEEKVCTTTTTYTPDGTQWDYTDGDKVPGYI